MIGWTPPQAAACGPWPCASWPRAWTPGAPLALWGRGGHHRPHDAAARVGRPPHDRGDRVGKRRAPRMADLSPASAADAPLPIAAEFGDRRHGPFRGRGRGVSRPRARRPADAAARLAPRPLSRRRLVADPGGAARLASDALLGWRRRSAEPCAHGAG